MGEKKESIFAYGETWMCFCALTYALGNIFDRVAMSGVKTDPFLGAGLKAIPHILLALIFILLALDKKQFGDTADNPQPGAYRFFIYSGFVSSFLGQISFLQAIKFGGVNVAVPTVQVWTLICAIIGVVWLKEKFHKNLFIGLICAVVGLVVLSYGQFIGMPVSPQWYLGLLFGLLTACCWAASTSFFTKGQRLGVARFKGILTQYLSGLVFILFYILVSNRVDVFWTTPANFYYMILLAGVFSVVATILMYTAVRLSPMSKVIPINASYPALAAILAAIFLKENLSIVIFTGIILVAVGVVISQKRPEETVAQSEQY